MIINLKTGILFSLMSISFLAVSQVPPSGRDMGRGMGSDVIVSERGGDELSIFKKDGKFGLRINDTVRISPVYDWMDYSGTGDFVVKSKKKYGIVNKHGKALIPIEYDSIFTDYRIGGEILAVMKGGKYGTYDRKGNMILSPMYDKVLYSNPVSRMSMVENKAGERQLLVLNDQVSDSKIEKIIFYVNGLVGSMDGKYGWIKDGKVTIPFEYDSLYQGVEDRTWDGQMIPAPKAKPRQNYIVDQHYLSNLIARKGSAYGLLGADGVKHLEVEYDKITYDHLRHIYHITKNKKSGVFFEGSKKKLEAEYESVYTDGTRFIRLRKDKKFGMVNYNADLVLPFEFDDINIWGWETEFKVVKQGKQGIYNAKGEVVIPVIYDGLEHFYESKLKELYEVRKDTLKGVISRKNEVIIPIAFDEIYAKDHFFMVQKNSKRGLYGFDGKEICPVEYTYFYESYCDKSPVMFREKDSLIGAINKNGKEVLKDIYVSVRYIQDELNLLSTSSDEGKSYMAVKDKSGKFGVFEEFAGKLVVPVTYDDVVQKAAMEGHVYFVVRKNKKYGLIDQENKVLIPFLYDAINLDMCVRIYDYGDYPEKKKTVFELNAVARQNGKYGIVDFKGNVLVPFQYAELARISSHQRFKARKDKTFVLIDNHNKIISAGPFDEVANFESDEALTFYNGMMKVINEQGVFLSKGEKMRPHKGYKSMDELKRALVEAMNDSGNAKLKKFAERIAPSDHIMYFIKVNKFTQEPVSYIDARMISDKYYSDLLKLKYSFWDIKDGENNLAAEEYSHYDEDGYVTNYRVNFSGYGDRLIEHMLRGAIKVNGYWISTYFMSRQFDR